MQGSLCRDGFIYEAQDDDGYIERRDSRVGNRDWEVAWFEKIG